MDNDNNLVNPNPAGEGAGTEGGAQPPTGNEGAPEDKGGTKTFAEDWKSYIPENLRDRSEWSRINKPEDLFNNYIEQTQMISKSVRLPDENSTPEQINAFYQKLGKPADKSEYDFEYNKQETDLFGKDSFDFEEFKELAEASNLSKKQYSALANKYLEIQNRNYAHYQEDLENSAAQELKQAEADLRQKWGNKYESNIRMIETKLNKTYAESTLQKLADSGLLRDTNFLEHQLMLTKMQTGDTLYIDGNVVSDVPQTLETLTAQRDELMAKDYQGNKAKVNELNQKIVSLKMAQNGQALRASSFR